MELLDQFPTREMIRSRMHGHDDYGFVLLAYVHDATGALAQFDTEIGLLKQVMTPASIDDATAYWHRGAAYAEARQFDAALRDFDVAEKSVDQAEKFLPQKAESYKETGKKILAMHADLLNKMGRLEDAQKLTAPSHP